MNANALKPVLIIGGSGVVGAQGAQALRRLHPELPIAIAGRDLARAEAVAATLGHAQALRVDLQRADLGLPEDAQFSAVVLFVKDDTLNSLKYAQRHGLPYVARPRRPITNAWSMPPPRRFSKTAAGAGCAATRPRAVS
ncbi:MAG: hypothetical protein JF591_05670 [Lysobacter sp.]|nr:hypothetical protein [Lysobacter sp.]